MGNKTLALMHTNFVLLQGSSKSKYDNHRLDWVKICIKHKKTRVAILEIEDREEHRPLFYLMRSHPNNLQKNSSHLFVKKYISICPY
jgi:hypothetical protein